MRHSSTPYRWRLSDLRLLQQRACHLCLWQAGTAMWRSWNPIIATLRVAAVAEAPLRSTSAVLLIPWPCGPVLADRSCPAPQCVYWPLRASLPHHTPLCLSGRPLTRRALRPHLRLQLAHHHRHHPQPPTPRPDRHLLAQLLATRWAPHWVREPSALRTPPRPLPRQPRWDCPRAPLLWSRDPKGRCPPPR